jgi:hypothetical protein
MPDGARGREPEEERAALAGALIGSPGEERGTRIGVGVGSRGGLIACGGDGRARCELGENAGEGGDDGGEAAGGEDAGAPGDDAVGPDEAVGDVRARHPGAEGFGGGAVAMGEVGEGGAGIAEVIEEAVDERGVGGLEDDGGGPREHEGKVSRVWGLSR